MRRPLIAGPTTTLATTTMPPRCLDVWIPFLPRWLKTPLLSQQRSQSCIFRGAGAGAEIVHGDLSTRAGIVSSFFFAPQQRIRPPRPVGGVSIKHYLSWCGWRTLKKHPLIIHYKFRAEVNLLHPAEYKTSLQCFTDSAVDLASMFYCRSKQNGFLTKIRELWDHSIFVLFLFSEV